MDDNNNRRQAYRCEPSPVLEPIFSLFWNDRRVSARRVIDVNMRGARVEFRSVDIPQLKPGSELTATIQAPGLDGWLDIDARVVFNAARGEHTVLALVFPHTPDVADRSDAAFFSVFNRRQERRDERADDLEATLSREQFEELKEDEVPLRVVNHSSGGIGFVVDESMDHLLRGRDALSVTLRMTKTEPPRTLTAKVLHRATRSGHVYYGCTFAA